MRQFNTPPGWPDPPNARWRPPKRWGPAESWPPAPAGWRFWIDEDGRPVRGPIGRYGGPSIVKLGSVTAVVLALIGLVLFNPFAGGGDSTTTSVPAIATETPSAEGTTTAPETPTTAGPATVPTSKPTDTPTNGPTPTPTATPTPQETESPTSEPSTPKPSSPMPTEPASAPTTTTSTAVVFKNCAEARAAGKAPLHRGDPGYSAELDNNGDGTACERGNS